MLLKPSTMASLTQPPTTERPAKNFWPIPVHGAGDVPDDVLDPVGDTCDAVDDRVLDPGADGFDTGERLRAERDDRCRNRLHDRHDFRGDVADAVDDVGEDPGADRGDTRER